jgi:hypothetical protein
MPDSFVFEFERCALNPFMLQQAVRVLLGL